MSANAKHFLCCLAFFLLAGINSFAQNKQQLAALHDELKKAQNDTQRVNAYNHLAMGYRYFNPDTAISFARKGLELAQKMNYKLGEGKSIGDIGIIFEIEGKFDLSKEYISNALAIFQQLKYIPGITNSLNELGTIAGRRGNYDSATRYFLMAQKIEEENHDMQGLLQTYMKLGVASDQSDNLDEALNYYQKFLKLNEALKDHNLGNNVYNNIGIIYGKKEEYNKALEYFQLALADSATDEGLRIKTISNLAIVYGKMGDLNKSLKYQTEALELARARHLPEDECRSLINLGNLYEKKDPTKSLAYLEQARVIAEKADQKDMILSIMASMVMVNKNAGRYKEALDILERQRDLSNQIFSLKKAKEIGNLQATYELDKSKTKVEELQIANKKNELQRNIVLIIACSITIIAIVVIVFYSRARHLNTELTKQKEELKELNKVKDKLLSIIGHDLRTPMAGIVGTLSVWNDTEFTQKEKAELIEHFRKQSTAALDTLDKLLYWGQAQIKGIRLKQQSFNPAEAIERNIDLVDDAAHKKGLSIINLVDANMSIYADPSHFDFIVRNLLSNAIKFSNTGECIEISAIQDLDKGLTTFAVKDNGRGIPAHLQERIFNLDNESLPGTANEKGTSIGLTLCREYVQENGGTISVESEEGKGTTFRFTMKNNT